jgi:hypothetical protein
MVQKLTQEKGGFENRERTGKYALRPVQFSRPPLLRICRPLNDFYPVTSFETQITVGLISE